MKRDAVDGGRIQNRGRASDGDGKGSQIVGEDTGWSFHNAKALRAALSGLLNIKEELECVPFVANKGTRIDENIEGPVVGLDGQG